MTNRCEVCGQAPDHRQRGECARCDQLAAAWASSDQSYALFQGERAARAEMQAMHDGLVERVHTAEAELLERRAEVARLTAVVDGMNRSLTEAMNALGDSEASEARLTAERECWEPGHVYQHPPPFDDGEHRHTRVHCVICTDAAMENARRPLLADADRLRAALAALERYNCDCLNAGPDGRVSDAEGAIYCQRWVVLAADVDILGDTAASADAIYTDKRGVEWARPTAEAYAMVCAALEKAEATVASLREPR